MLRLYIYGSVDNKVECESGDSSLWIEGSDKNGHTATLFLSKSQAQQIVEKINQFWPEALAGVQLEWLKECNKQTMATIDRVFNAGFKPEPVPTSDVTEKAEFNAELAEHTFGI